MGAVNGRSSYTIFNALNSYEFNELTNVNSTSNLILPIKLYIQLNSTI